MDAAPPVTDQCLGASDWEIVSMHLVDAGAADAGIQTIDGIGMNCALGPCLEVVFTGTDTQIDDCLYGCYQDSSAAGLSSPCIDCFADAVLCGRDHCAVPCAGNDVNACAACLDEYGCVTRMHACAGF